MNTVARLRVFVVVGAVVAVASSGCAHTIKTDPPTARTIVDGENLGQVGAGGKEVKIAPGVGPVKWRIDVDNGPPLEGTIARTEPIPWMIALGIGGALCCFPASLACGFCAANPGVAAATLAGCAGLAIFATPSWLTVPSMFLCGTIGLSPLAALPLAETIPSEVLLPPHGAAAGAGAAPSTTPTTPTSPPTPPAAPTPATEPSAEPASSGGTPAPSMRFSP